MDIYSIWAKAENGSLDKAKEIINEIAEKEKSTSFNPHVTLVTSMYSQAKAEKNRKESPLVVPKKAYVIDNSKSFKNTTSQINAIFNKVVK